MEWELSSFPAEEGDALYAAAAVSLLLSRRCLWTLVGLGVVAGACAWSEPGFVDLEFEGVVVVRTLG
jgi:hypothetical protein